MTVSEWKAKAAALKRQNPKSLATWRPESPKAMNGPMKPKNRFDENGRSVLELDTALQVRLYYAANKLLAKAGFFDPPKVEEEMVLEPVMIGTHGLRPTWHGRA